MVLVNIWYIGSWRRSLWKGWWFWISSN